MQPSTLTFILTWFVAYTLPIAVAGGFALSQRGKVRWLERSLIVVHVALVVSIVLAQCALHFEGIAFPWFAGWPSLAAFALSAILAAALLGVFGLWYALSAFIQELTMLSVATLLLSAFPLWATIALIAPVFVACHFFTLEHWLLKLALISTWGIATIVVFALTHNIYLIVSLHTLFGTLLYSRAVLQRVFVHDST